MLGQCAISGKPVLVRRRSSRAHTDAIEVLVLESAEFELPKIGATACLMVRLLFTAQCPDVSCPQLFYQYGERKHSLKRCSDAVEWFLLGTRRAFSSVTDTCSSRCFRKAAVCHIEQEEYAQASDIIRQCPGDEAATHYLSFLVAIKQGKGYFLGRVQWHSQFPTDLAPKDGKMMVRIN
jgi:hypothetical protein